ncbi:hypothetical protein Tco_0374828, partial [Tanacetum coccineum]
MPGSFATPSIKASYSASLLVASNMNLRAYVNYVPSRLVSIRPAQEPSMHDEPSVNNIQGSGSSSLSSMDVSVESSSRRSIIKSARIYYALWEVIVNGDSPPPKRTIDGVEQTYPLTTVEEKLARKNELKARAIEKRFGGNMESKKTQKKLLKQQYENFNGSSSEGLDQTYDRLQKFIRSFSRECRAPRENRNREPVRRNVIVETTEIKALVAQDGLGYDWSDQAKEGPTNFTLMAFTSSGSLSSSSSDYE